VLTFTADELGTVEAQCTIADAAGATSLAGQARRPITPVTSCDDSAFLQNGRPYLQLGTATPAHPPALALLWMPPGDVNRTWSVEVYHQGVWTHQGPPAHVKVDFSALAAVSAREPLHRVYTQELSNLPSGGEFLYRIKVDGTQVVFQDLGRTLKPLGQPQRIVLAGDLVSGDLRNPRRVADRLLSENPDLLVVPGDIVNLEGHAHQYRESFFSIYNSTLQGPTLGAPLLRKIPTALCLGNNDTDRVGERRGPIAPYPNGLA
jgi:hypothetical protein